MSHLTANPFQKPFEFPRLGGPLTPPDTEDESHGHPNHSTAPLRPPPAPVPPPLSLPIDIDSFPAHRSITSAVTEVPQPRKGSSVTYIHTGPREARERVVQRGVKWLVMVIPPVSVITDQARFGHTLSVGSSEKLAQGLLMPLFPTMSGQLGAIAREFAFPSTAGLCLYLHANLDGIFMTPRISDESWQLLWANLLEPRSPTGMHPTQLPIGGRLEFDVDMRKARWYDTWLGLGRRDMVDVPVSVSPSRPQSMSHWREESRTTFLDDQGDEHDSSSMLLARPSRLPGNKHIPRKLSLLDRYDSSSLRSNSKVVLRNSAPSSPGLLVPPDHDVPTLAPGLSPIMQEEEPKTARKDVDRLVNTWRASASLAASPLAYTGQTSLDPVNLPNDIPIEDSTVVPDMELNLDDFTWSVSSLGPPSVEGYDEDDDDLGSIESWRLPSVHLDRRMMESVCLTPSTHTSWGPDYDSDYDYDNISLISYLPSPDIATRQLFDCPPTPSTATSWGPPSYPPSPAHSDTLSLVPSIDIAQRNVGSVPVTPSTATSWGPPLEWPASPATPHFVRTPDVGQRSFDEYQRRPWHYVWPYRTVTGGQDERNDAPWQHVWPYQNGTNALTSEDAVPMPGPYPSAPSTAGPWHHVWPYETHMLAGASDESNAGPYPFIFSYNNAPSTSAPAQPWHQVWPYRATVEEQDTGVYTSARSRSMEVKEQVYISAFWRQVVPYTASDAEARSSAVVPSYNYPYICIYHTVYPHFDLYPAPAASNSGAVRSKELPVLLEPVYPNVRPYAPGYPVIDIYPAVTLDSFDGTTTDIEDWRVPQVLKLPAVYPALDIYPGSSPYPKNVYEIYAPVRDFGFVSGLEGNWRVPRSLRVPALYPAIDIYPGSLPYPRNVYEIYAPLSDAEELEEDWRKPQSLRVPALYPAIDIYPGSPPYPRNVYEIYAPTSHVDGLVDDWRQPQSLNLPALYPAIDIYPGSSPYPRNVYEIYAPVPNPDEWALPELESRMQREEVVVSLPSHYPHIELYPAGCDYPNNLKRIYPPMRLVEVESHGQNTKEAVSVKFASSYPNIVIYEPVYPWNVYAIYPAVWVTTPVAAEVDPTHYPHNLKHIYPAKSYPRPVDVRLPARYPTLDIYPAVYPWNLYSIYPSAMLEDSNYDKPTVTLPIKDSHFHFTALPYPQNLDYIYPPLSHTPSPAAPTKSLPHPSLRNSRPHLRQHNTHHVKRSSSTRTPVPPVPPLPQNVDVLRPIHPASHKPLSGERVALSLPVRLPTVYPRICPYPPVYPHLEIYPEVKTVFTTKDDATLNVRLGPKYPFIEIYPSVYPYLEIYPQPTAEKMAMVAAEKGFVDAVTSVKYNFLPRRRPKRTHEELHRMVFGPTDAEDSVAVEQIGQVQIVPVSAGAVEGKPVPYVDIRSPPTSPRSPRQLPPIPPQVASTRSLPKSLVETTRVTNSANPVLPPAPSDLPSPSVSPLPRSRARSGTVSARPPLPTPPPAGLMPPVTPQDLSSATDSQTRVTRRLPLPPVLEDGVSPALSLAPAPRRPLSMRAGPGLPSSPAAGRRMSIAQPPLSRSASTPLAPVLEPGSEGVPPLPLLPLSPSRRPLPPQPRAPDASLPPPPVRQDLAPATAQREQQRQLHRSNSENARPPAYLASPPEGAGDLARTKSLPAPPMARARRDSVATSPIGTGVVAGLARAFNASVVGANSGTEGGEGPNIASTLAQFPPPPRPPLPSIPANRVSRPVSKLDRSKYPFA